jgi:tetratricopeptide (TPR) repeat protein
MKLTIKHFSFVFLFILLQCIPSSELNAQLQGQPLVDSLTKALPQAKNDTSKIKTLYLLAVAVAPDDSAASLNYATQCMNLSKQIKWQKGIGLAYYAFAKANFETTNYLVSLQNTSKAYTILSRLDAKENMAVILRLNGVIYQRLGYYTKSLESLFASLKLFEAINDKHGIETCYNNIGNAYVSINADDKAIDNYNKALKACKEINDRYGVAAAVGNIATIYFDDKKYDSAKAYYLQAIKVFEAINYLPDLGRTYFNLGNVVKKQYDAASAYTYFIDAITIDKKLGATIELADDYGGLGSLYYDVAIDSTAKYIVSAPLKTSNSSLLQSAIFYLKQSLAMSKEEDDLSIPMNYSELASAAEEKLGNYKEALAYHKEYTLYKDSIFNDANKKKIAALETQRVTEVKNKEIQLLNQERALEASEVKRQTLIRNIIIASVVIIAVLSFIFIRAYNRRKKFAFDQQVSEVEMKALRAQMNPHFIFNSLQSINRYMIENEKENASAYLLKFANLMRLILENSREQDVPLEKDLNALELYMQLEALRFKNRFKYTIETAPDIDKENTLIPPLLLQPFVENAIIHGMQNKESGLIKISVHKENGMMKCVVEDNGHGRAIAATEDENKKRKSLGLKIISERLDIINRLKKAKTVINVFDLQSADNKQAGLRIELLLPLELAF